VGKLARRAGLCGSRAGGRSGLAVLIAIVALSLVGLGCGSGGEAERQGSVEAGHSREAERRRLQRQVAIRRAHVRIEREIIRRHARRAKHQRERQARERRARVAEEEAAAAEAEAAVEEPESSCDPNYSGACLDPTASDYDCEGGSGDGPGYTSTVAVVGEDHYGLDADSDGIGCESE
jgi:hypothetical protein